MKIIILARTLLSRNSWFVGAFQALLMFVSIVLAWLLRFDFTLPDRRMLISSACLLIAVRMVPIAYFGLLHGWWRYTGLSDALDILKAVLSGSALFLVALRYVLGVTGYPRTIFIIEPVLTAAMLIGVRIFSRVLAESVRQDLCNSTKVLLIGAGTGAQTVVRELKRPDSHHNPVGYVDDDRSKLGLKIEGIPVLGTVDQLPQLVQSHPIDEVLIAVPRATSRQMQRFVEICEQTKIKFRTVPALQDVIEQRVSISNFRDVDVEDLLGRDPVEIDLQSVKNAIHGRSVMITGAAGSVGSELCRQILEHNPQTLLCVDQNETAMFYLERELRLRRSSVDFRFHIADVGDRRRMEQIFKQSPPESIYHAAAYKHVPLMETNVPEAVRNNIFGLMTLLDVAVENDCDTFILVSSDKAVNPTNVMGATKRIDEMIIAYRPTNGMRCLSVRFGNVLGSNGSVVPVLQQQLRNNQPLTVTHPEIKRFFMTIREAVSLVLQASVIGEKGDTLVLDMGQPLPILELVRTLIRLSGRSEEEVKIEFTGLRPGEKLSEELFYADEEIGETSFPKIKKARGRHHSWDVLINKLEELEATLYLDGHSTIRAKIREIVPQYLYSADQESTGNHEDDRFAAIGREKSA